MADTRAQMEQARAYIQVKKYDEARAILRTVNHPKAQEWLTKIDALQPPPAVPAKRKGGGLWWKIPALLLLCSFVCVASLVFYGSETQRATSGAATLTAIHEEYCSSLYRVNSSRWDACMNE